MKPTESAPIPEDGYEFSCPGGELDEVFIANASVHIERMDDKAFWIGIQGDGKPMLMLNTGVHQGQWYFNIEVDSPEYEFMSIQRPRKGHRLKKELHFVSGPEFVRFLIQHTRLKAAVAELRAINERLVLDVKRSTEENENLRATQYRD